MEDTIKTKFLLKEALALINSRDRMHLCLLLVAYIFLNLADIFAVAIISLVTSFSIDFVQDGKLSQNSQVILESFHLSSFPVYTLILWSLLAASLILIFKSIFSAYINFRILKFLAKLQTKLSSSFFEILLNSDLFWLKKRNFQETSYVLTDGINKVLVGYIGSYILMVSEFSLIFFMFILLLLIDFSAALFSFIFFGCIIFLLRKLLNRKVSDLGEKYASSSINSRIKIENLLLAFKEIAISKNSNTFVREFQNLRKENSNSYNGSIFLQQIPKYILEIAIVFGAFLFSALQFFQNDVSETIQASFLFLVSSTRIIPSLLRLYNNSLILSDSRAGASICLSFITDLELNRKSLAPFLFRPSVKNPPEITINNLSFSFPDDQKNVIDGLNLTVSPGEFIAITGVSGVGKTTFLDLLLGFYSPSSGTIEVKYDNYDDFTFNSLFVSCAYVSQNSPIIVGSVAENIAIGVPDEHIDLSKLKYALETSAFDEVLGQFPQGLKTILHSQSSQLSGGEKQRLSLARAIYSGEEVLLIDEGTNSLDNDTELRILNALRAAPTLKTVILVTHQINTRFSFDRIFSLELGKLKKL